MLQKGGTLWRGKCILCRLGWTLSQMLRFPGRVKPCLPTTISMGAKSRSSPPGHKILCQYPGCKILADFHLNEVHIFVFPSFQIARQTRVIADDWRQRPVHKLYISSYLVHTIYPCPLPTTRHRWRLQHRTSGGRIRCLGRPRR